MPFLKNFLNLASIGAFDTTTFSRVVRGFVVQAGNLSIVGDGPHLDGKFSAFGRVRSGIEVADEINNAPLEGEKPEKPVRITRALVKPCTQ